MTDRTTFGGRPIRVILIPKIFTSGSFQLSHARDFILTWMYRMNRMDGNARFA
jgi:hypothetical protein